MLQNVVRKLWLDGSSRSDNQNMVTHGAMVASIHEFFPHKTLTNADVILFPDDSNLRCIVSEPASDFFRDTARHWKWIADWSDGVDVNDGDTVFKELDAYAAEEFSEFLSVLAVGVVELAAEATEEQLISAYAIESVFSRFENYKSDVVLPRENTVGYSESVKAELQRNLPKQLFSDITESTGVNFVHRPNPDNKMARVKLQVPLGIAGGGVSVGDYDGDALLDIYFAGAKGGQMFRNLGDGTFGETTDDIGMPTSGETRAGYFVDYDNDGDQDLFLTFVGVRNRLLNNDGSGLFTDVSEQVGILNDNFISHEAVWFDFNNDGLLELYVANFGDWLNGESPTIGRINSNAPANRFYVHELVDGQHKFIESAESLAVDDRGWTHCVGAYDIDLDGWTDLFSINDFGASQVYRNLNGTSFEEVSRQYHLDDIYNGMSFSLLDLNHNSNFSIYVSQIMKLTHRQRYSRPSESTKVQFDPSKKDNLRVLVTNRLFTKAFESSYRDDHNFLIEPTKLGWSWDVSGLDFENDSDLDLLVLNGTESVAPTDRKTKDKNYYRDRAYLAKFNYEQNVFFVQEDGYFYKWTDGNPIAFFGNSRGSSFFDADHDGDIDVVVSNYETAAKIFENRQTTENNWIEFKLTGTKSNRNAIGAVVEIQFDGKSRFGIVTSGSGFLSQNPYQLHFGLGGATEISQVIVTWPSGITQKVENLAINRSHDIVEK